MERPNTISTDASWEEWSSFFGQGADRAQLPHVTIANALEVPAVLDAVTFLSRTLAALPLHAFRDTEDTTEKVDGDLQMLLNEAPNEEWSSFALRQYFWQQVFTGGRGLAWIERRGVKPVAIWPLDPTRTSVRRQGGRKIYRCGNVEYPATDVIDVPFALKANQLDAYGPIHMGRKAIGLAIAMNDFAAGFFVGGGIPPLALEGPLPSGVDAFKRALADIRRAIDLAKRAGESFFGLPPGHKLTPVGADPAKGQMTEARLFQIQEIARLFGLPPVFLQDLSKGTFSNTEQQDLQLVKHLVGQWAKALEDELNLKLFGQRRRSRKVKHNLDGIQRGDFKSRTEGLARAIQTGQITPNEARALENRPPLPNGDVLYIQGATVPLGEQPAPIGHNGGPALNDDEEVDADKQAA
ncbi:phage portal protein [Sphingomonas sp. GM_Shp_2]|uniref:phage portal protein n=1 Tax=Sphingomonas sp. GM_Shp_2 TaxID=2937380 RepID=UPI00226A8BBF|nr:phage portal protein [Sphingomonas sp. GM_Shp_2]